MKKTLSVAAVAACAAVALVAPGVAPAAATTSLDPTVVVQGLNNPRQLSLIGTGQLLIAEAGRGGDQCVGEGEEQQCAGTSGAVSVVLAPQVREGTSPRRIVSGLLSAAGPDGSFALGATGVSARSLAAIDSAVNFAPPEAFPPNLPGDQAGKLLRSGFLRPTRIVADIAAFEAENDPDGQGVESNPYASLAQRNRTLVADAAANTVVSVDRRGDVSLFAVLPTVDTGACADIPNEDGTNSCDPVPTSLAEGRDGYVYVGGLVSDVPGEGRVWKLDPRSGAIVDEWSGFTGVVGVAVGRDGSVYASELFANFNPETFSGGALTKVAPDDSRVTIDVPFPGGVAVDRSGRVYVSAYSIASADGLGFPGSSGQVWRFRPAAFGG